MTAADRPRTMQAAILVAQREPLVVDQVELPEALGHGQVLVRLAWSGICGSQLGEIAGAKGPDAWLPHLLGHEGSGRVVEVGPGVKLVRPGDQVVLHWMKGRGLEAEPPRYRWRGRPLNAGWVTTFNEWAVVSENRVTPVPAGLDGRQAALLGCAVTTGLGAITNDARVRPGESVVILGAGGVGLNMVQGAALCSAWPIVAVDLHQNRLALARALGATHALDGRGGDLEAGLRAVLGRGGADVVVDNTGQPELIELAYRLTKPQGRVVLVGVPHPGQSARLHTLALHFGKVLTGSHGGQTEPSEDIPRYLGLVEAGRLRLEPLISQELPLARINEALEGMRSGALAGRCLLDLGGGGARP
jgi:S-(hydroxymethyl)glutathione dehydrogenase/alcohol dehydrogenase